MHRPSEGDRVELEKPPIVERPLRKYWVHWDSGQLLAMLTGEDCIRVVETASSS